MIYIPLVSATPSFPEPAMVLKDIEENNSASFQVAIKNCSGIIEINYFNLFFTELKIP